ncbi:MFS transporter [Pseudoalteromonas sp. DY56-GL79]|uniref:MFS transporter n=1 Tax=Pseudoalteromonas sp. DY56-GL79 TaxID=2967131 RepID=UPI00352B417F
MTRSQFATRYGIHLGLTMFASMLVLPIFTPYMLNLGLALQDVALAMVVMAITIVVFEVPSGIAADAIGRRKVFLASLVFAAVCNLLLLLSEDFWHVSLAMACWGLSQASLTGTLNAWFVETYQKLEGDEPLNKGFGKVYGIGYLIGASAALFAALFLAFATSPTQQLNHLYQALILISIAVLCVVFACTFVVVKESTRPQQDVVEKGLISQTKSMLATCKQSGMQRLLLVIVFAIPVASSIEKFWPALAERYSSAPVDSIAWIFPAMMAAGFVLNGVAAAISAPICSLFGQRLGYVMAFAHFAKLVFVLLLAWVTSLPLLIVALLCFYLCMGLAQPAQLQLQHQLSSDNVRASVESIMSLTTRFGGLLGSALTALLLGYVSLTISWIILGAISLVAIMLCCSSTINQPEAELVAAQS